MRPVDLRAWALLSYRAGETSQILGLAEALQDLAGIEFEEKRIRPLPTRFLASLFRRTTTAGIDLARSSPLAPPWPEIIVSAGAKNEPVARWIRARSGGRTKLVFLGRTWCPPEEFDLVITTPQYRLPQHPRILHNPVTITRITEDRLQAARKDWEPKLSELPHPRLAVLIGGQSGAWCFGPLAAKRLAQQLRAWRSENGGSILVTTSSRTSRRAAESLERDLGEPGLTHLWHRDPRDSNPYFGFLSCADEIVVTGDSIAMLSEAMATGLPIRIFDLGTGDLAMRRQSPEGEGRTDQNWGTLGYRLMSALGPRRLGRDIRLAHDGMLASPRVAWLGDEHDHDSGQGPDVRPATVARILDLFAEDGS